MGKIILSLILLLVSLKPCVSIPSWDLSKSGQRTNSYENRSRYHGGLTGVESLNLNSQVFLEHILKPKNIPFYEDSMNQFNKEREEINIEAENKIIGNQNEENIINEKEGGYILLIIYVFGALAIVLFTHFIYLRKYKKLVIYLREMRKENKELKVIHKNLQYLNSQLENQSEAKIKEMKDLNHGNENIRNQHERMLVYNFNLERIIDERTKQIADLNLQLSIKNKRIEHFVYIISRKTVRPIASLKGLVYLLESSINIEDKAEFASRLKACVTEMEELLHQANNHIGEKENESENVLKISS